MFNADKCIVDALIFKNFAQLVTDMDAFTKWVNETAIQVGAFLLAFEIDNNCRGWFRYGVRRGRRACLDFGDVVYSIPEDTDLAGQRLPPEPWQHLPIYDLGDIFGVLAPVG